MCIRKLIYTLRGMLRRTCPSSARKSSRACTSTSGAALKTKGVIFHEIGGTETHVHVAVSIPPTVVIAEWIGKLKGASSHYVNHELVNRKVLDWQTGYGVVSFGTKDLEWVVKYVRNPKEHHAQGTTVERLEKIADAEDEA